MTGNWFHVSPSAGAALVRVTLDELICLLNGAAVAELQGTGRWGNQPVQVFLHLEDGPADFYRLIIATPEAGVIYSDEGNLSRGDISIVVP